MTTPASQEPTQVQVAKLELEKAKATAKAIKLTALFIVLGVIFTAALLSHQDHDTVRWLGSCLFTIGLFGWLLL